jgi:hypothetical protein
MNSASGSDPFVYNLDLRGYGSSQLPTSGKVFEFSGYSDKDFDLMTMAQRDPKVLVNTIEAVEL